MLSCHKAPAYSLFSEEVESQQGERYNIIETVIKSKTRPKPKEKDTKQSNGHRIQHNRRGNIGSDNRGSTQDKTMERDKYGTRCWSSEGHSCHVGLPGRSLPRFAFLLYSPTTAQVRLDSHYFTAYLLLGTDMFTKHLPSYANGDISGGTTFTLPSSFFNTNTLILEAAQKSPVSHRLHHSRMVFPLWERGSTYPSAFPSSVCPTQPTLHFVVRLREGFYFFYLVSLWYPFNL